MSTAPVRTAWVRTAFQQFARTREMTWLAAQQQYRGKTATGFRALILSLSHYAADSVLEVHLGLRHELVESTAFRYTNGLSGFAPNSLTVVASTAKLRGHPFDRYVLKTRADAERAAGALLPWLENRADAFWNNYQTLAPLDAALNDSPEAPTLLMPNQSLRCLRGLVVARYAQRPDWPTLIPVYRQRLEDLYATEPIWHGYERLVDFLRTYTPN